MSRRNHERKGTEFDFLPRFESLEERLLLTTVHGGEFFVYHNSAGEAVRVSLQGSDDDAIELFAYDAEFGGVVDLVGLPNGVVADQVKWSDGLNIVSAANEWIEYNMTPEDGESPRGSRTEIYAIYIASCSEDTVITISTLEADQPAGDGWADDVTQFSSTNLPVLSFLTEAGGDLSYTSAPAGSGGVVIGSKRIDDPDPEADPVAHSAVALTTNMAAGVPVTGVFPGGDLHAGISIAATKAYALMTVADVGTDVQAVASDGTDAYVVDLSAYFGRIISDGSDDGLGSNVQAIASDAAGNMFGVDSGNVGETSSLVSINSATGACTPIGLLQGVADPPTVIYRNVAGMDFNGGGVLYATSMVEDLNIAAPSVPAGLYLITINTATGVVTRGPAITGLAAASSIAFDAVGTLYGVDSDNQTLYTINTGTGVASLVGNLPVSGFIGIEFVDVGGNEVLYGATNRRVYAINPADPTENSLLGDTSRTDLTSLTFDANQPGMLWSTGLQDGYRLVRIGLSSMLVQSDNLGNVTNLGLLFDSVNPAFGYDAVHALTFDAAGDLWGIGTLVTIDPVNSPIPDPAGAFLIKIDTTTGTATKQVADPLDVDDLTSMAFDALGDLYGLNPADDSLVQIDPTDATTSLVANLDVTGIVGIDFNAAGGKLYAVTADSLYLIDFLTGSCTKVKSVDFTGLTSLSTIPADVTSMYSTVPIDGTYYLITIDIEGYGIGTDVQAVASDGTDAYVVDLSAYFGKTISDGSVGGLGSDVQATASDAAGNMFGVDSGNSAEIFTAGAILGTDVRAVAVDAAGNFYYVDEATHNLGSATIAGGGVVIGGLFDTVTATWRYDDVQALDFNPIDGLLYGVGTVTDTAGVPAPPAPAGPYLMTINTATGDVTMGSLIDGVTNVSSIAFAPDGTLYAVNSLTNELIIIDPATGNVTVVGTLTAGISGIDFIYNAGDAVASLYGVTANGLYHIDTTTASCTALDSPGLTTMTSLAYDATQPRHLFTTAQDDAGDYRLARTTLTSSFMSINSATGGCTSIGLLLNGADQPTVVYRNVAGLDFNGGGVLYATATVVDLNLAAPSVAAGLYLVTINTATGVVTRGPMITGMAASDSIAFNTVGTLYGVNGANQILYTIDTVTGVASAVGGALPVSGFVGIEFVDVGGNEVLYGATNGRLYAINPANPSANVLLGDTSRADMTSLTFDATQPGMLWSAGLQSGYRLVRIGLSSMLVQSDNAGNVTELGLVFDSANPALGYDAVHALTFDGAGDLWGIGTLVTIDPINSPVPVPAGAFLIKIDTVTGVATRQVADPLDVDDLTSMAFDGAGDLYGVNPDGDELVLIDTTDATTSLVMNLDITGIVGIDFDAADDLYAVTSDSLYFVDVVWEECLKVKSVGITGMTSLSTIPADPTSMYSTVSIEGTYYLISIDMTAGSGGMDMGRIIVGGTLAGSLTNPDGSIDLIEMGYLWGKIDVAGNIGQVILRQGSGAQPSHEIEVPDPDDPPNTMIILEPDSWIDAGGSITEVSTRGGTLYSFIRAQNDSEVLAPQNIIYEMEYDPADMTAEEIDAAWIWGDLVDYDNNSMTNAQFLTHPTGNFFLLGDLPLYGDGSDWYALPLLAGQTVTLDGGGGWGYPDPRNWQIPFTRTSMAVYLYDSSGRMMDSLGYETVEDMGLGSVGSTQKPMTFTAPAADVYYIGIGGLGSYVLSVTNGTAASLGAVNVVGNYDGSMRYDIWDYYATTTPEADVPNIMAMNAGTIGAVVTAGNAYDMVVRTFGAGGVAGDIVAYMAGNVAGDSIYSDGNIGLVASTTGIMSAKIAAGHSGGMYNHDAFIQNIACATDFYAGSIISTSGSIGVIEIGGTIESIDLTVNDDLLGGSGHVDLIDVGGDWGGAWGIPSLSHGPGGDFGYVNVSGIIYVSYGGWYAPIQPTILTEGQTGVLNDDGGGRLTVTPEITGGIAPTWSYVYIGVDDDAYPGFGAGGIIANLSINGSATLSTTGVVQLPDLDLSGMAPGSTITIEGTGQVDIWYVHSDVTVDSFVNTTPGGLVSGNFGADLLDMRIAGSIGPRAGTTDAWLYGYEVAPVSGDITTEPQYGWFHGTLNGLMVAGNLDTLYVGGSLGDLRVLGEIGQVVVDSDGTTPSGKWHGVTGIVWSQTRIGSIDVGDGLADDGGAEIAQAAIMSTGSIGTVSISGPRYVTDNVVFGELNGAIIGRSNELIDGVEVDAIGEVIGTDGAVCTAIIVAVDLDAFQIMLSSTLITGGIGTVSFSGPGAEITGSEIRGQYIRTVSTSEDSNGINWTTIRAEMAPADTDGVGQVIAGGPGMHDTFISVNGGGIGDVVGLGPDADIWSCVFVATDGMNSLSAQNVYQNGWHMPGTVETITAYGDMFDNEVIIGALIRMGVAGDFSTNSFTVAGAVGTVTISGEFDNSVMILQGPTTACLWSLTVGGDISGTIISGGGIGSIISLNGAILADISTLARGSDGDVNLIQTAGGYTGSLIVGGTLKEFVSYASLGDNPADTGGVTQRFEVWGNVVNMAVGGAGNMYADLNVGGSIGTLYIGNTLYGRISTNGMLYNITVRGNLGGLLDMDHDGTPETPRGSLNIGGTIQTMSIPNGNDIFADLSVGGSIGSIGLVGGSIIGNIESRFGSIGSINVVNGDILGELKAKIINKISITGGTISGNIITTGGSLTALAMGNSTLDADITVEGGRIDYIYFVDTDLVAGRTIYASGGLGSVTVSGGNIAGDLVSRRDIWNLRILSGNLTGNVWAETDITNLSVYGNVQGSVIRSGGSIGTLGLYGLTNSTISSANDIAKLIVLGDVDNSMVLAGFDVGPDMAIGGGDDTLHSGGIGQVSITGQMQDSIFVAGIGPGADGDYLLTVDNVMSAGISNIGRTTVQGGFVGVGNGILAETSIDPASKAAAVAAGVLVFEDIPAPAITPPYGPNAFGALTGPATTRLDMPDGLSLILAGDGVAEYDGAGNLTFEQTTARSYLKLIYDGGGAYGTTINIIGADDSPLGYLVIDPDITVGNVTVDGYVGTLQVGDVAAGSAWNLPGGVAGARLGDPADLNVTAGNVGFWIMSGNYAAGAFTADSVQSLGIAGNVSAPLDLGSAGTIKIFGDFTGTLESWGTVGFFGVYGTLSGNVNVYCGDLLALRADDGISGTVNLGSQTLIDAGGNPVEYGGGKTNAVYIVTGDFGGGAATATYRTAGGVGMFTVGAGDFSGLLSTDGNLGTLTINGEMTGKAWAAGSISVASTNDMTGAMLAASGDLLAAYVRGNMTDSYIFAGFNPGDAGFDAAHGGEDANLQIDAFTPLVWRTVENTDHVRSGRINNVGIAGTMTRSVISAGVGPGADGFVGTGDDLVLGASEITAQVFVFGDIVGSANASESYGIYAANNLPVVIFHGSQPFSSNGNARVGTYADVLAGNPTVIRVLEIANSFIAYLNHPLNPSTVDSPAFVVLSSVDDDFGTTMDNTDVSGNATISYSNTDYSVTIALNVGTWDSLGAGDHFQVTLTDTLADSRGNILDGEYTGVFPSGDGASGGDFVYSFQIGQVFLADVPAYGEWWHGCSPTAAGMMVGYYDTFTGYEDLIVGDASTQTDDVKDAISSPGNIADYALYDGVDDYSYFTPYPDMSEIDPAGAHTDDSIADFMHTSQSADGLTHGGTWMNMIGLGVEEYVAYRLPGHTASSTDMVWGALNMSNYSAEIKAGRPVLLGVDSDGDGQADHSITGVGYDLINQQYAYYNTWDTDLHWADFQGVAYGQPFGIHMATFVMVN